MITHFTYKPFLSKKSRQREYQFSCFYNGEPFRGIYHYNGSIDWAESPEEKDIQKLTSHIHELMLFHVYDS